MAIVIFLMSFYPTACNKSSQRWCRQGLELHDKKVIYVIVCIVLRLICSQEEKHNNQSKQQRLKWWLCMCVIISTFSYPSAIQRHTILPVKSLCEKKFKSNEKDLGIRLEIRRLHPCSSPTMNMKFLYVCAKNMHCYYNSCLM